uniref:Uncharacterized protein n=1 Tax=Setaria italica TaxID=4555 RepID=K4A3R1_SETIT
MHYRSIFPIARATRVNQLPVPLCYIYMVTI